MGVSVLISAWMLGALGGVHCAAMWLPAISARDAGAGARPRSCPQRPCSGARLHHGGRHLHALGAPRSAGALALNAAALAPLQRVFYITANVFLVLLGLSLVVRSWRTPLLQRAGARLFGVVLPGGEPTEAAFVGLRGDHVLGGGVDDLRGGRVVGQLLGQRGQSGHTRCTAAASASRGPNLSHGMLVRLATERSTARHFALPRRRY